MIGRQEHDLCSKVSKRVWDQKMLLLMCFGRTLKLQKAPMSWGSLLASIGCGQRGLLPDSWIGTVILSNTLRHPVTGGRTGNTYKGEESRQTLIFNVELSMEDCWTSFQNLKYAYSLLSFIYFIPFYYIKKLPFQMASWIFYSDFKRINVQNAAFSSNDLWPINMNKVSLLRISANRTQILQKLVKI